MSVFHNLEEGPHNGHAGPSNDQFQYSEQEIRKVAIKLSNDNRSVWSQSPRLYIILRDMNRIPDVNHLKLIDKFIENDINDSWLPIPSKPVLDCLMPVMARPHFLRAQDRVCGQPRDFQLGSKSFHGHFTSKESAPFRRLRVIGRGHIGEVDEVLSLIDGKVYARKTIRRGLSDFSSASKHIRSFRRELQVLRRIEHVHCVKLVGSYTDPSRLALIMSPVADCNLSQYLRHAEDSRDPIASVRLRRWFGCLATGIQYLHANKIRHRDVKPDNILVHGRRVLLVDFELSLDWKDLSHSTTTADCGKTPLYAAPEVILHKKRNSSSDIWSLGCVFLEMATVLKGRHLSEMQSLFKSQSESPGFYNNEDGIIEWISYLKGLSETGNAPFVWISRMLQHDKALRPKATVIVDLIFNSHATSSQSSLYFGNCCQSVEEIAPSQTTYCPICNNVSKTDASNFCLSCSQCSRTFQSYIHRNPQLPSDALPVQLMRPLFHPYFIKRHLTRSSMEEFTRSIVAQDCWDSLDTKVWVSCLPGQALRLDVRSFAPQSELSSLQKDPESHDLHTHDSLPVGIYEADPLKLAQSFNGYLDNIVDHDLEEQSRFILQVQELDHSSQVLDASFRWFDKERKTLPDHEVAFLKAGIKIVAINKILGQSPVLAEMPRTLTATWPHRSSADNQSSRLLNRQVKVAFFLLQSSLIEQALVGLRYLLRQPESQAACLFISLCLSFILERMIVHSREYLQVAKEICDDEAATTSDADDFCHGVYSVVFERIYRELSLNMRTRTRDSVATRQLLKTLDELRSHFELEGKKNGQPELRARYPSPLVSALLKLVKPA